MNNNHTFNEVELVGSLQEALAHAKWKPTPGRPKRPSRTARITPAKITWLRRKLNASTTVFAAYLNVTPDTVRSWEKNKLQPSGPALRLLEIVAKIPRVLVG